MRSRASSRIRSRISRCSSVSGSTGTRRSLAVVIDRFYVISVGIEHVGAVVARVVDRPLARRAVVPVTGGERDAVELLNGRVVGGRKRDVHVLGKFVPCDEGEGPTGPG